VPDRTDAATLVIAGACVAGGIVVGFVLRVLFGRLGRRAGGTDTHWDDVGWALVRGLALPAGVTAGLWWAAEVLQLREPVRGIVDRVLLSVVILAAALALAGLAAGVVRSIIVARTGADTSASIFVNVARVVVLVVGVLVVLAGLGISITPMLTALGVGGLAVALALQEPLANVFAGIQVLASKQLQPGDYIRLDSGEDGYVVDITWRNTTIRQLTGNLVVLPNAKLASSIVTNFHQPAADLAVIIRVGVSYASDLARVEQVTIEVAQEVMTTVEGGVPDFEPFVRYHTFGDWSVDFNVIMRAAEFRDQFLVTHEFIKRLHDRYRAEGIRIPFPIRTIVPADGARTVLPAPRVSSGE
jgi:small-conductance mechanosensitive channel